jgi:hypothetical protein
VLKKRPVICQMRPTTTDTSIPEVCSSGEMLEDVFVGGRGLGVMTLVVFTAVAGEGEVVVARGLAERGGGEGDAAGRHSNK